MSALDDWLAVQEHNAADADDLADVRKLKAELASLRASLANAAALLRPFAKFAAQWNRKPISNLHDDIYSIHVGTEFEAVLRRSDCEAARAFVYADKALSRPDADAAKEPDRG